MTKGFRLLVYLGHNNSKLDEGSRKKDISLCGHMVLGSLAGYENTYFELINDT